MPVRVEFEGLQNKELNNLIDDKDLKQFVKSYKRYI